MTTLDRSISMDDGVCVHDCLIFRDQRGSWWAYHDQQIMFSVDRDDLLLQVARATDTNPDLVDLIDRLERSIARAEQRRVHDAAVEAANG